MPLHCLEGCCNASARAATDRLACILVKLPCARMQQAASAAASKPATVLRRRAAKTFGQMPRRAKSLVGTAFECLRHFCVVQVHRPCAALVEGPAPLLPVICALPVQGRGRRCSSPVAKEKVRDIKASTRLKRRHTQIWGSPAAVRAVRNVSEGESTTKTL